jgi:hypothetical protein
VWTKGTLRVTREISWGRECIWRWKTLRCNG